MDKITQALLELRDLEERFRKILDDPALNGAE